MNITLDDIIKDTVSKIKPKFCTSSLNKISNQLDSVINSLQKETSKYSSNIITDNKARDYVDNEEEYEEILNQIFTAIIETDDYSNGTFCRISSPNWEHIQTAYILRILYNFGMTNAVWGESYSIRSIKNIIEGLLQSQKTDGNWGEDFYDTCYVLIVLLLYFRHYRNISNYETTIKKGLDWVVFMIERDFETQKDNEWFGAGFIGVALSLFAGHYESIDDISNFNVNFNTIINKLMNIAMKYYNEEQGKLGYFTGDLTSQPTTPNAWHTAEMVLGLNSLLKYTELNIDPENIKTIVDSSINWLFNQRNSSGLWHDNMGSNLSFIVTGRILNVFCEIGNKYTNEVLNDFLPVLKNHYHMGMSKGIIHDLPVTINILLGLSFKNSIYRREEINQFSAILLTKQINSSIDRINDILSYSNNKQKAIKNSYYFNIVIFIVIILLAIPSIDSLYTTFYKKNQSIHYKEKCIDRNVSKQNLRETR